MEAGLINYCKTLVNEIERKMTSLYNKLIKTYYTIAVIPELGALPIYDCPKHLICEQGANCTVAWKGQKKCGSVGTVVMSCMKHLLADAPRLCLAGEKGCICS